MDCTSCFREMDAKQELSRATFGTIQGKKSCLNMLYLLLLKDEFFDALGYIIISYLTERITDYS